MQTEVDPYTRAKNHPHRALVVGQGSLADALVDVLEKRGIPCHRHSSMSEPAVVSDASLIFHAWFPDPKSTSVRTICEYPNQLLEHSLSHADSLIQNHPSAAIINFSFLPAIYVGTELEDYASALRGGITGVTRTLARKFGKQGLRVTCVQAGLCDMPETKAWVSEKVSGVAVPCKRWASPQEIAKFMVFLAADSMYTTGQTMIIDGGLTAGITGT